MLWSGSNNLIFFSFGGRTFFGWDLGVVQFFVGQDLGGLTFFFGKSATPRHLNIESSLK